MRKPANADPADAAAALRLMQVFRTSMRLQKISSSALAAGLGFRPSYLSRLFKGTLDLRMAHVLAIARHLGLQPGELFQIAFLQGATKPSKAAMGLVRELGVLPPFVGQHEAAERVGRRFAEAFQKLLADIGSAAADVDPAEGGA